MFAFLAIGYRVLTKRGAGRARELLWYKNNVNGFEDRGAASGRSLSLA